MTQKEESAALEAPRSTAKPLSVTDSSISIAQLLDLVNRKFPDILPESVLRHFNHKARPDGELGEDVLYSSRKFTDMSSRGLLANALESAAQNDIERNRLQQYKAKIDILNQAERRLREMRERNQL